MDENKDPPYMRTSIILNTPTQRNLVRLAALKHTNVSHLLNEAAEEYLRRYVESRKEPIIIE